MKSMFSKYKDFKYQYSNINDKINVAKQAQEIKEKKIAQEKDREAGLVNTYGYDNNGKLSKIETENGGTTAGTSKPSDHGKSVGLGHNAGAVREAMAERAKNPESKKGSAQSYNQNLAYGGRIGYGTGGIVSL